jgi:hypothetical protein
VQTNSETGKIEPMPGEDLGRLRELGTTEPGLPQKSAAPTQEPPGALSAKQRRDSNRVRRALSALGAPEREIEQAVRSLLSSQH